MSVKILVSDDEPYIVNVVSAKLKNGGFEVVTAADGQEAYELAREQLPDLVVTDYQMPFLSGLEMCAKLRGDPVTQHIPVVMLTARGYNINENDCARTNIRRVLPKPFSPREVLKAVKEVLEEVASSTTSKEEMAP